MDYWTLPIFNVFIIIFGISRIESTSTNKIKFRCKWADQISNDLDINLKDYGTVTENKKYFWDNSVPYSPIVLKIKLSDVRSKFYVDFILDEIVKDVVRNFDDLH